MKYLSDSEILKWNDRLVDSDFIVRPRYNNRSSHPDISISQRVNGGFGQEQLIETLDPHIKHRFVFSVAVNRVDNFFSILENLQDQRTGTKVSYTDTHNNTKLYDIDLNQNLTITKKELQHNIFKKQYTRFEYLLSGKLSHIMAYVSYLEDSIEFFSQTWGYNEDGTEVTLVNFPIGSIVSDVKDKSRDYIVLDYIYRKMDSKYYIDFQVAEVLGGNSGVIKYGRVKTVTERDLCFSRNGRIDDILN